MVTHRKEKAMLKIFSRLAEALRAEADAADTPVWMRDPLSHPDIETMDARALGDLPFGLFRAQAICADGGVSSSLPRMSSL
jgi:hypothetical protein